VACQNPHGQEKLLIKISRIDFCNSPVTFPSFGFVRLGALTLILTRAGLAMDLNALQRLRFVVPWANKTDFE